MHLEKLAAMVAQESAQRFLKKAGIAGPLAVGVQLPGIVGGATDKYTATKDKLDLAAYQQLDPSVAKTAAQMSFPGMSTAKQTAQQAGNALSGAASGGALGGFGALAGMPLSGLAQGLSGVMGKGLDRAFFGREFGEQKDPMHMMGSAALQTFGKEMGTSGAGLLRDIANKAMASVGAIGDRSARQAILQSLKKEDPVLANADDKVLLESYHTMERFAPTLSTDKNAVRSFLRQAVMSGNGPDYMAIKLLADTERSITGDPKGR